MSRLLRQLDLHSPDRRRRIESRKPWKGLVTVSVLLAVLAGSGAGVRAASTGRDSLDSFTEQLDTRVTELMASYEVPGAVLALVSDGQVVWSEAYGYADVATRRPMTVDTVNRTESISKSLTAWGVMRLVEQGVIDLDDAAAAHIDQWRFPESPHAGADVTIRQLLNHTAGLPLGTIGVHYPPDGAMPSLEENLTREARLVAEPGTSFLYSNVGFNTLESVIEGASGRDFADYMREEVLVPLGMDRSTFGWSPELTPPIPTGYELDGTPVPVYVYPEKASGGLLAPVEDIARFVAAGMTGSYYVDHGVLSLGGLEELYNPNVEISGIYRFVADSYGLGHFVETLSTGQQAVWHGGQGHGWMTHFHSVPNTGDGIVILTNSQRSWPMIAHILGVWSEWNNLPPVGMTFINQATTVVWVVVAVLVMISLLLFWRAGSGLVSGKRHFAPLSHQSRFLRLSQALFAVLILILGTSVAQDLWAFFITPLFPRSSTWLAASTLALALALLSSALTPPLRYSSVTVEGSRRDNVGMSAT